SRSVNREKLFKFEECKRMKKTHEDRGFLSTPKGSRTPVLWLRTRCPGPLDDGGVWRTIRLNRNGNYPSRVDGSQVRTDAVSNPRIVYSRDRQIVRHSPSPNRSESL